MPFVVDASVVLTWAFEDETIPWAEQLLDSLKNGDHALVPSHWPLEIANGLLVAIRRGRFTHRQVMVFAGDLNGIEITVARANSIEEWPSIITLAQEHRLTAYDAAYLALAMQAHLPLATLDKDLIRAARATGVPLIS